MDSYHAIREGFRTSKPLSGLLVYNFIFSQSIAVEVVFQWFLTLFSNRWQRWRVLDSHSGLGISRKSLLQLIKLFLERRYSHAQFWVITHLSLALLLYPSVLMGSDELSGCLPLNTLKPICKLFMLSSLHLLWYF